MQLYISIPSLKKSVPKSQKRTIYLQAKQVILNQILKLVKARISYIINKKLILKEGTPNSTVIAAEVRVSFTSLSIMLVLKHFIRFEKEM